MNPFDVRKYQTLVFDCDGVLLDSNKIKTQAFYQSALPFGDSAARALVDYHVRHGGISRYKKFDFFFRNILGVTVVDEAEVAQLVCVYASQVKQALLGCDVAPGLDRLRQDTSSGRWLIVSGGDQLELREVFSERKIDHYFDAGIFGSPDTKDEILARELMSGNIKGNALFFGDSQYDYEASASAGLDFAFVSQWSEFLDWQLFFADKEIYRLESLGSLS